MWGMWGMWGRWGMWRMWGMWGQMWGRACGGGCDPSVGAAASPDARARIEPARRHHTLQAKPALAPRRLKVRVPRGERNFDHGRRRRVVVSMAPVVKYPKAHGGEDGDEALVERRRGGGGGGAHLAHPRGENREGFVALGRGEVRGARGV